VPDLVEQAAIPFLAGMQIELLRVPDSRPLQVLGRQSRGDFGIFQRHGLLSFSGLRRSGRGERVVGQCPQTASMTAPVTGLARSEAASAATLPISTSVGSRFRKRVASTFFRNAPREIPSARAVCPDDRLYCNPSPIISARILPTTESMKAETASGR
jgi:hypothetical protein